MKIKLVLQENKRHWPQMPRSKESKGCPQRSPRARQPALSHLMLEELEAPSEYH